GKVAAGEVQGSLAIAEQSGSYDPAATQTTVVFERDGAVLNGEKRFVMEGDAVDELVVIARAEGTSGDDGVCAVVVPVSATRTTAVHAFDESRRLAHVRLDGVRVDRDRVLGEAGTGSAGSQLRRAIEASTVALALEIVGT